METKHTPGPWTAYGYEVHDRGTEHDASGARIGNTPNAICTTHYIPSAGWDQRTANARLIAAAPDLLKELQHLVRLLTPLEISGTLNVPGFATLNGARAAIAKATEAP